MQNYFDDHLNSLEIDFLTKTTVFEPSELQALFKRFNFLDRKECGYLSFTEFEFIPEFVANPFRHLILQHAEEQMDEFEKMNFAYFLDFLSIFHHRTPKSKRINLLFSIFDLHKSHRLCSETLVELFRMIGINSTEEEINEILKYDTGQKGYLDITDFTRFYNDDESLENVMVFDYSSIVEKVEIPKNESFLEKLWRS